MKPSGYPIPPGNETAPRRTILAICEGETRFARYSFLLTQIHTLTANYLAKFTGAEHSIP